MRIRPFCFAAAALLFFSFITFAQPAPAQTQPAQTPQFLRFVEDANGGGKLEAAIVTYKNSAGITVHLVSALHVAEKSYYQGLAKTFEDYDVLLYEMVKYKDAPPPAPGQKSGSAVSGIQRFLKDALDLDFQLDDIDYTKSNFVNADLDYETFSRMQDERGESIFGIMIQSMLREMRRQAEGQGRKGPELGMIDLLVALKAPDRHRQLKILLARQFDNIEDQIAGLTGPNGSVIWRTSARTGPAPPSDRPVARPASGRAVRA